MEWINHKNLEGCHAFMSASKPSWLNYDDDKICQAYMNSMAAAKGTELHEFASTCIRLGQKLPRSKKTLNMFVNDAIGYKMQSEQLLFYSENCFGTADAISFRDGLLRIHDLKTGVTKPHEEQLFIYAALFCLEYHEDPRHIEIETRIYQNDDILAATPDYEVIMPICDKIVHFDNVLKKFKDLQEA